MAARTRNGRAVTRDDIITAVESLRGEVILRTEGLKTLIEEKHGRLSDGLAGLSERIAGAENDLAEYRRKTDENRGRDTLLAGIASLVGAGAVTVVLHLIFKF